MKLNKLIGLLIGLLFLACNNDPRAKMDKAGQFGEAFVPSENVVNVSQISLSDSSVYTLTEITGTVEKYCKGEGCWLTLKQDSGQSIRVNTKDKAYILPRNLEGMQAIAKGRFVPNSKGTSLVFEADGIILK